ncbi:hypothetical protein F4802DRAFT_614216 [Xylaria palmicola]|nr:hypothetical protein F4802DRAFT_614216 [Xylaria palmicola]
MSEAPQCSRMQHGYLLCACAACLFLVFNDDAKIDLRRRRLPPGAHGFDGSDAYSSKTPIHLLGPDEGGVVGGFGLPIAPQKGELSDPRSEEKAENLRLESLTGSSPVDTGGRGTTYHSSPEATGGTQQSHTQGKSLQQARKHCETAAVPSSVPDEQARPRPKRRSKYGDEPPRSVYGPPFTTRSVTADMSAEEAQRCAEHNAAVAEARRAYGRHKNARAAQRSRDRKLARAAELASAARQLGLRLRQVEDDNARLREENEVLRRRQNGRAPACEGMDVEQFLLEPHAGGGEFFYSDHSR